MQLNIRNKLLAAFVVLLVLTAVVGWIGITQAGLINDRAAYMYSEFLTGTVEAARLADATLHTRALILTHILSGDAIKKAAVETQIANADRDVDDVFKILKATDVGGHQKEQITRFERAWSAFKQTRDTVILPASRAGKSDEATSVALGESNKQFEAIDDALEGLIEAHNDAGKEANAENARAYDQARVLIIGFTLAAVLAGLVIAWVLSRNISINITAVVRAAQALTAGDLSQRARVQSGTSRRGGDEIAVLADAFNTMAERLQTTLEAERQAKESLQTAVREYVAFAGRVAQGDLTTRLRVKDPRSGTEGVKDPRSGTEGVKDSRKGTDAGASVGNGVEHPGGADELGNLSENLNRMVVSLGDLSGGVRASTQAIGAAAAEILAAVSEHTASANQQSAAVSETSATVEEVRASAEQTARKASDVAQLAQASLKVSQEGLHAVQVIVEGMRDIRAQVQAIAQDILALSEKTQQIGEITVTVNDIADQSNLLALNAAIEAAKAGEQGKGFAVVAAEVRNLAEQSKQATGKVRAILGDIQKATNAAVLATEQGTHGVETGTGLAQRAGEVIGQLGDTIRDAAQAAQQIAAAAHQQSTAMDQIAQAIKEINQATVQFLAGARQSQLAAESLNERARHLQTMTEQYKLAT